MEAASPAEIRGQRHLGRGNSKGRGHPLSFLIPNLSSRLAVLDLSAQKRAPLSLQPGWGSRPLPIRAHRESW